MAEHLTANVAEAELKKRVVDLQNQLQETEDALNNVKTAKKDAVVPTPTSPTAVGVPVPLGHKGYLFKWQDRSIGWSGTKWDLRFVSLSRGKLSYYRTHTDSEPRYQLTLRGCAVRDEGEKPNSRHTPKGGKGTKPPIDEVGAYFHVFSIFQRDEHQKAPSAGESSTENPREVVPLLRFSTPSLAEKSQWMNLISEACAYCDTDAFLDEEYRLAIEQETRKKEAKQMEQAMPTGAPGTLPPLIFAQPPKPKLKRYPSGSRLAAKEYRTKSVVRDADKVTAEYPPSKPMHRASGISYLSSDAPVQSYRGLFNLAVLILIVSNTRLLLETVRQHGFVLSRLPDLSEFASSPDRWADFPIVTGFVSFQFFILSALGTEWLLSRKYLSNRVGMSLHYLIAYGCLASFIYAVYYHVEKPLVGAILLFHAAITWMKLLSYCLANEDYRTSGDDGHVAISALVEDLETTEADLVYPKNVNLRNMYYYWLAPTLTYQIAFPRSAQIRLWKVAGYIGRLLIVSALIIFLGAQVISPNLESLVSDLEESGGAYTSDMLGQYGLRLSIVNTYMWLLCFYWYFHLYLNLFAELLRFGDRVFYKDWWNSSDLSSYWRLWNMPVHFWLVRHVYFPCVRLGMSRSLATFTVFFVSAVIHEVLISIPFHMLRPWTFLGMISQVPLVLFTKKLSRRYPGSSIGNIIFWISFCLVGQPMAILLYTIDYKLGQIADDSLPHVIASCTRKWWGQVVCHEEL